MAFRIKPDFVLIALTIALTFGVSVGRLSTFMKTEFDIYHASGNDSGVHRSIRQGWIPPWIPANATDVYEAHDLDNNASILRYTLPQGATFIMPNSCHAIDPELLPPARLRRAWWPREILEIRTDDNTAPVFFTCHETGGGYAAVLTPENKVYLWR